MSPIRGQASLHARTGKGREGGRGRGEEGEGEGREGEGEGREGEGEGREGEGGGGILNYCNV